MTPLRTRQREAITAAYEIKTLPQAGGTMLQDVQHTPCREKVKGQAPGRGRQSDFEVLECSPSTEPKS